MSRTTDGKVWGMVSLLLLVLPVIFLIPAGSMGESTVTLKVTVVDEVKDPITDASVSAVNVHSGVATTLYFDATSGYYSANVMPGTYEVTASADDFGTSSIIVEGISEDNQGSVHPITLLTMDNSDRLNVLVRVDGEPLSGATAYVFADGFKKSSVSGANGWANFTAPNGPVHLLIFAPGELTYSVNLDLNASTTTMTVDMLQQPSGKVGSFRIMGFVKSGSDSSYLPGIEVHVWDVNNSHPVPIDMTMDGSISLPLYSSVFRLLIESDGFEPVWVDTIDLTAGDNYYSPADEVFEMTPVATSESRVTTVDMSGTGGVASPTVHTVWTLDANSRVYGFDNDFGTPRMQVSGPFYSSDWLMADAGEADAVLESLISYGPAWAVTDDFLRVNGKAFTASDDYDVTASGFEGNVRDAVNPVVDMTQGYTSELAFTEGNNLRVEVLTVLPGEQVLVKVPSNYEILGDFGEKATFPYLNSTSQILVKEPLEFNAKKVKAPVAVITFSNSYDHYRAWDRNYTVALNKNVTLSADGSSDLVGKISSYTWTIPMKYKLIKGNVTGTSEKEANKITVQFTENSANFGKIDLVVTDSSGIGSKPSSIWIKPDGIAPTLAAFTVKIVGKTALLEQPINVDEDVQLEFNASDATDNGNITSYVWTFGDKSGPLNGKVVKYMYADPGTYNISLKIVDSAKNELKMENVTKAIVKDITKPMAVISPFPSEPKMGTIVTLNASQSYDPRTTKNVETLANYTWTWFDRAADANVTFSGKVVKHNFTMPGDYNFNLTVTDAAGLKGWTLRSLRIRGPDLEVRNVEFRDPSINNIQEGKKAKISIPIVNNGILKVDGKWTLKVYLDGKKVHEKEINAVIKPSETYYDNFTFTPSVSGKNKELKVVVDANGDIDEEVEKTNTYTTKISIKAKEPIIKWWWFFIALAILLVIYVVFMKVTRNEWGYEPILKWWESRKKKE